MTLQTSTTNRCRGTAEEGYAESQAGFKRAHSEHVEVEV